MFRYLLLISDCQVVISNGLILLSGSQWVEKEEALVLFGRGTIFTVCVVAMLSLGGRGSFGSFVHHEQVAAGGSMDP